VRHTGKGGTGRVTNTDLIAERIQQILRPYSVNWSGMRSRGDLVIPQREIPQVVEEILEAIRTGSDRETEITDSELFDALMETRRAGSVQDQMDSLRRRFTILSRGRGRKR
jgi:hypothetical protein